MGATVPASLVYLVEGGWTTGPADALLLREMYGSGWRDDWSPQNVASHELEVNDVWIPPDGLDGPEELLLTQMAARARRFAVEVLRSAEGMLAAELLVAVISVEVESGIPEDGATVKFCTRRGGFPGYYDDLERYGLYGMAIVEAADVVTW
ncbi:hypothetical protein [Actinokineospora fastidiosa]|uniref:hypothetical protein n=1 Tax=Actinokineospora fastidiosa TaxID=1816 RepID=UPI00166FAAB9|nr:hypothetical protein [Actinokineospora fastidiosa]